MGVTPNPKMAFIFPISCILALIFPILIKYFPKSQVKKWVGIPVGSHWDPNRDHGGIYRDKNSGSRLESRRDPGGIPPRSRWDSAQIPTGFWRDLVGFDRDPVGIHRDPVGIHRDPIGIHWDPSGIKTRDFAGSQRDPTPIPTGFTVIPAG